MLHNLTVRINGIVLFRQIIQNYTRLITKLFYMVWESDISATFLIISLKLLTDTAFFRFVFIDLKFSVGQANPNLCSFNVPSWVNLILHKEVCILTWSSPLLSLPAFLISIKCTGNGVDCSIYNLIFLVPGKHH